MLTEAQREQLATRPTVLGYYDLLQIAAKVEDMLKRSKTEGRYGEALKALGKAALDVAHFH